MKRYLMAFLAAAFVSSAFAQTSPDAVVKTAVEGTVNAMKADTQAKSGDMAKITGLVETRFLPYTDFLRTTRIAVGKDAWSKATPEQKKQLFEQFQRLLVRTYALSMSQLRTQEVSFKFTPPSASAGAKDTVVKTHVISNGDDQAIDYRLAKTPNGWKIYDINMMGAWLIQVYQRQFAEQIVQGGIDGLIKFLTSHNARGGA
jgi:phospholipid transport system substrate-binding protein